MRTFFGILMLMGINYLPQMRLYWSANPIYSNMLIKKQIKRTRFDILVKLLHFLNNEDNVANKDRLFKIRHIQQVICEKFQEILVPADVVIDETMVLWRGRSVFRQYLPAKSHKYGVKIYKPCTPGRYTYNLKIYSGKNDAPAAGNNEYGHGNSVSMELLDGLLDYGRILYVDNFYTTVQLASTLLHKKTYICDTFLRKTRKRNPETSTSQKLKRNQVFGQEN